MRALLAALSLVATVAFASDPAERPRIVFHGQVLFDELLYRSVLDLPPNVRADASQARAIATKLRSFLRRAGYELATVRAEVRLDQIVVDIDEGQLDKVVVLGQGLIDTFRFRLELSLPAKVFNRPILDRQLRALAARFRLHEYSYKLVPLDTQDGSPATTMDELEHVVSVPGEGESPIVSGTRLQPGHRYELQILITGSLWARGFSPELTLDSLEGLGAGGQYRGEDLLVRGDRWEFGTRAAANLRDHLDPPSSSRPVLTRLVGQARWFFPPVWAASFRPTLTFRGDLLSLQRSDLRLDDFQQATFGAALDAGVFRGGVTLAVGLGVEQRFLFSIVKATGANPAIDATPRDQTRPYAEARGQVVFNPGELRSDRKNVLDVAARLYVGAGSAGHATSTRASFRQLFHFGWHELAAQAHGTLLTGEVLFPDEEYVGGHLHGFAGSDFSREAASAGLEYRQSLLRDVIKVGLFWDQVVFGRIDRTTNADTLAFGGAVGPALHLLLADQFQLDLYLAFGWSSGGATGVSPSFVLRQVY